MPDSPSVLPPQAKAPTINPENAAKALRVCELITETIHIAQKNRNGLITLYEACEQVGLTAFEFMKICAVDRTIDESYQRARETRAAYHVGKLEELPDAVEAGEVDPLKARVSGGLRQWLAQKHDKARYGDALQVDQRVSVKPDLSGVSEAALEELYQAMSARRNAQLPGS